MKKIILSLLILIFSVSFLNAKNFHNFSAKTINGEMLDFSTLKGKRILVVNVASYCGYTPQYEQLQELFETYGGDRFAIIAFPANNFNNQEPGSDEQIEDFCKSKYGVTFQMMSKISVKGNDMHEVYQWLTQKSENGKQDAPIKWNFQKFMIDENGDWVATVHYTTSPMSPTIQNWLKDYVSVDDTENLNFDINIYPNPSSDYLNIELNMENNSDLEIDICDQTGNVVSMIEAITTENTITINHDISGLASGKYFVRFRINNQIYVKQFVITK